MICIFDEPNAVNVREIFEAIKKGEDILIRTYRYQDEYDYLLERVLEKILAKINLEGLKNALTFCVRELTGNARKAIVKRIFFNEQNFSLENKNEYEKGMKIFHRHIYNDIDIYTKKMKAEGFFISFNIKHGENELDMTVSSNTSLTNEEKNRIESKLGKVKGMKDLGSQLDTIIDTTEGAGLGLIMITMMLQKEGIPGTSFTINKEDGRTVSRINFKKGEMQETPFSIIARTLIKEVQELPQFPENVKKVINMSNDKNASISSIATVIKSDVSMAADLLKLANSAYFMLPKRVKSIEEALKIVGIKGLKSLIYSYGTMKSLYSKYGKFEKLEEVLDHSNKVSFYAVELAKNRGLKDIIEDVAIGGLLHDLGKIVIMTLHPERIEKIKKIVLNKSNIQTHMVEELILGINHARLGGMMAEYWNFPEHFVKAIEYHHIPGFADEHLAPSVYSIYLANSLTEIERGILNFRNLNREVLEFFNIFNPEDLEELHHKVRAKLQVRLEEHEQNE